MYRHSPSRNQRSKGFKLKHVLQFFVLVAVCFWLIYQVKHSQDKRKEFDENDAKITQAIQRDNEILKFGRKDLNTQVKETSKENEKHDEDAEEETGGGEDEDDNKTETKEDDGKGGGDDELDESDQGKSDSELDHEKEFLDEEKAREEGDEKEIEEKDLEDVDRQTENMNSVDEHDHDGGTTNTHEAREEQYKADDASSAVTHVGQTISTENDSGMVGQVNIVEKENKINNTEESNIGQNTTNLMVHEGGTDEYGTSTVNEEKGSEVLNSTSQGSPSLNSIITSESNDQPELSSDSNGLSLPNGTEIIISDPSHAQSVTEGTSAEGSNFQIVTLEQPDNSSKALDNSQFDSNSTTSIATENVEANPLDSSNSSTDLQFVASEHTVQSNVTAETKDGSESTIIEANANTVQNENSDTNGGTDGTFENSSNTENGDELQHDTIDSSIPLEDKEDHIDLDTLPDIRTEGSNSEEAAEE